MKHPSIEAKVGAGVALRQAGDLGHIKQEEVVHADLRADVAEEREHAEEEIAAREKLREYALLLLNLAVSGLVFARIGKLRDDEDDGDDGERHGRGEEHRGDRTRVFIERGDEGGDGVLDLRELRDAVRRRDLRGDGGGVFIQRRVIRGIDRLQRLVGVFHAAENEFGAPECGDESGRSVEGLREVQPVGRALGSAENADVRIRGRLQERGPGRDDERRQEEQEVTDLRGRRGEDRTPDRPQAMSPSDDRAPCTRGGASPRRRESASGSRLSRKWMPGSSPRRWSGRTPRGLLRRPRAGSCSRYPTQKTVL